MDVILPLHVLSAIVCGVIARHKGFRVALIVALGAVFGVLAVIGVLIAAPTPGSRADVRRRARKRAHVAEGELLDSADAIAKEADAEEEADDAVADEIARLAELRDHGQLTDDEYETRTDALLDE